jgi:hypothetical protein
MGQASASSSADSAINATGAGVLNINQPNKIMWLVIAGGLLLLALYLKRKGKL